MRPLDMGWPQDPAEFDRLMREAFDADRCPVDGDSHAVRFVYGERVCSACDCDLDARPEAR